ncbi:trypsin-like peptidase domain-containing protein [Amycolatopsis lurida]
MPKLVALVTCVALALAGCTGGGDTGAVQRESPTQRGDGLLAQLRDGGLTIVIRHAATDRAQPDAPTVVLDDCATQRNLSDQGRADARAIGDAIDRLTIPIGQIWASPYCRSSETAELAFGRFEVVPGLERLYPERDEQVDQHLNQLIRDRAPRADEPNLVIASHGVYPSVLAPAVTLAEGEAAIYTRADHESEGAGGFELVDRILPNEWAALGTDTESNTSEPSPAAARVADSVVALHGPGGTGSAFRVAVPGILVTAAHLVANAHEVLVTLPDGEQHTVRVLGRDPAADIAALRIADDSSLPPLHSGSGLTDARAGDPAFGIGGGDAITTTSIRALHDPATIPGGGQLEAIRVDTEIPRANVGGPLVNDTGDVLGVLTTATGADTGIAIPVDVARNAALRLVGNS